MGTSVVLTFVMGCTPAGAPPTGGAGTTLGSGAPATPSRPVGDGRLELQLEIAPGVVVDRVPMRTAVLRLRNVGTEPLRIYLPNGEAFRWGISSLRLMPDGAPVVLVPEPQPHGYVVTEADFHLLQPGETHTVTQPFTLDPFVPGPGLRTARRPGFEAGRAVRVEWTYENHIPRWPGGAQTLDGVTQPLFGGGDIPHLWLGSLTLQTTWTVPPP